MTRQQALSPCSKRYRTFTMNNRKVTLCAVTQDSNMLYSNTYVGISICNPNDKYDSKLGRNIAYDRANYCNKTGKSKHIFKRYGDTMLTGMIEAYLRECEMRIREEPSKYIKSLL